jgi:hypothetical protein
MLGPICIAVGVGLMILGVIMLASWLGGKSSWMDAEVLEREGSTVNDRQFVNLYFLASVIAPLLVGATLIVYGLTQVL